MTVVSTVNMLSKVGADLRWFLEREGVDPEQCVVSIGVPDRAALDRLTVAYGRDFDARTMRRDARFPAVMVSHGVPLCAIAKKATT
jgi:hypothetical protein